MRLPVRSVDQLSEGDLLRVHVDGRPLEVTVSRVYWDPSLGAAHARTVVAHVRPGGYSVTLRDDHTLRRLRPELL